MLVVFGHLTAGGDLSLKSIKITRYLIYSFDMPMFIFMTGLFSKKKQGIKRILSAYIIPYIIFDSIYVLWCMVVGKEANLLILIPTFVYWYILCIALQKLMISCIRWKPVIFIIVLVIQVGTLFVSETVWRFLSIGRVGLLFPIFFLGYNFPIDKLYEMRQKKFISFIIGFFSLSVTMALYKLKLVPISATHNYYSSIAELGVKYIYMLTTFGLFIALNSLIPNSRILNRWGRNSLLVYLLHPYMTDIIGYFVRHSVNSDYLSAVICITSSILITAILSLDVFKNAYDYCMGKINKALRLME